MGKVRAVLAQADHLAADADDLLLAGGQVIVQVAVVLVAVGLGHEHLDVLADDLGRPGSRTAARPPGSSTRRCHSVSMVRMASTAASRIGAGAGLAVLELANGVPQVGDIAGDAGEHALVAHVQFADREVHGEGGAVLAQADDLAADADDLLLAGGQVVVQVAVVLVPVGLGHEHLDVLADDLGGRVAEEPLGRRVHRLDLAVRVDGEDRVDGRVEDGAGAGLAVFQFLDGVA